MVEIVAVGTRPLQRSRACGRFLVRRGRSHAPAASGPFTIVTAGSLPGSTLFSDLRTLENGSLPKHIVMLLFPANLFRFSRHRDTMEPSTIERQEAQIVQSCMTLDDFLP